MALVDSFTTATKKFYQPGLPDNIFVDSAFWSQFYARRKHEVGRTLLQPIRSGKLGGGPYVRNTQLTLTTPEVITQAEYDWTNYYVPIQLPNQDVELNAQAGAEKVVGLLDSYINSAADTMRDSHLGTDAFEFHDHDTYATLDSLKDMCQENAFNSDDPGYYAAGYGGILIADMPTWVAHVFRATGSTTDWTPVTCEVDVVRQLINEIVHGPGGCGRPPSMMVTTPTVFQKLSREIYKTGVLTVITKRGQNLVNAGFQVIEIDNIVLVADEHCPSTTWSDATNAEGDAWNLTTGDHLYAINFDFCWPNAAPMRDMKLHDWIDETDYDRMTSRLTWWGNIICSQRRAQGAIYNLDTTLLYDS